MVTTEEIKFVQNWNYPAS